MEKEQEDDDDRQGKLIIKWPKKYSFDKLFMFGTFFPIFFTTNIYIKRENS